MWVFMIWNNFKRFIKLWKASLLEESNDFSLIIHVQTLSKNFIFLVSAFSVLINYMNLSPKFSLKFLEKKW